MQNSNANPRKRLSKLEAAIAAIAPKRKRGRPAQDLPVLRPEDVVRPVLKKGRPATPIVEIPWPSFYTPSSTPAFPGNIVVKEVKRGRPPAPPFVQPQPITASMVITPIVKRGRPPNPPNPDKVKTMKKTKKMMKAYSNTMTMIPYYNAMSPTNNNEQPEIICEEIVS